MKNTTHFRRIRQAALFIFCLGCSHFSNGQYTISTIAGNGSNFYTGDGGPATLAQINRTAGIAVDASGNIYVVDYLSNVVRQITPSGIISTYAGSGYAGYYGDGGPATSAGLYYPYGLAIDTVGNLYISDQGYQVVRKVTPSGMIYTVAGNASGASGYSGDGGPATAAALFSPSGLAVDAAGSIFIADAANNCIRKVDPAGIITTIAGLGGPGTNGYTGDGGPATAAQLALPLGVALDGSGNLFIADRTNNCIRKINAAGIINTVAGNGTAGNTGDGGPASAALLHFPVGLAFDGSHSLYICEGDESITYGIYTAGGGNDRIRKIDAAGIITTSAGNGIYGFSGDGGPATAAHLNLPMAVATDGAGDVYISDTYNGRIRKVDLSGTISTVAGTDSLGDGGSAVSGELNGPSGMAIDASGNYYVADGFNSRIRKITRAGIITTVAGIGSPGYSGDGGPATAAQLDLPGTLAVDASGNIYVTEGSHIRKINAAGIISTFAGADTGGFSGDGGPATAALLNDPWGVAVDAGGNVYFTDAFNSRIRKINTSGIISTIAGNGIVGFSGDGGPATAAEFSDAGGVRVDKSGNIFVADYGNCRIRKISASGIISTIAGNGAIGFSGDNGPATAAKLNYPADVAVDGDDNVYFTDRYNYRIRKVSASGIITTIGGNGTNGYSGDGGLAIAAQLDYAWGGICVDAGWNVYLADAGNNRIRLLSIATNGVKNVPGLQDLSLNIFPNPSRGAVTLNFENPDQDIATITVTNVTGQRVKAFAVTTNKETTVQLSVPAGIYFLTAVTKSQKVTSKIIIE